MFIFFLRDLHIIYNKLLETFSMWVKILLSGWDERVGYWKSRVDVFHIDVSLALCTCACIPFKAKLNVFWGEIL